MEADYILDCAIELGEITALEHAVLRCHPQAYAELVHEIDRGAGDWNHFLQNLARTYLDAASPAEKYFWSLYTADHLMDSLKTLAGRAQHLVQNKIQQDLGVAQPLLPALYPEAQAVAARAVVTQEQDIGEDVVQNLLSQMMGETAARWASDLRQLSEAVEWYAQDEGRVFNEMLHAYVLKDVGFSEVTKEAIERATRIASQKRLQRQKLNRTLVERAKAAVKKATKLYERLGKQESLRLFVTGSEVTFSHPASRFKFVVKPLRTSGWLLDRTTADRAHTPYELMLFTKDDVYLSKLCVYFKGTPVLDQLLALSLYVDSGNEEQVLAQANWYSMGQWTQDKHQAVVSAYPGLAKKLPRLRDAETPRTDSVVEFSLSPAFQACESHWEPYKGRVEQWVATWMEPAVGMARQLTQRVPRIAEQLQAAHLKARELSRELRQEQQERTHLLQLS